MFATLIKVIDECDEYGPNITDEVIIAASKRGLDLRPLVSSKLFEAILTDSNLVLSWIEVESVISGSD